MEKKMEDLLISRYILDKKVKALLVAAAALSTAMVQAETKGADFSLVDDEWIELTAAILDLT